MAPEGGRGREGAGGSRETHWNRVFTTKADTDVSWHQAVPEASLRLVRACGIDPAAPVIDVGGGTSALVDHLLRSGHGDVTVLDVSAAALDRVRARLGADARRVRWIVADVTAFQPDRAYALWHDRAAFHFLTEPGDQAAYARAVAAAVAPGGWVVLATFAPHGPARCSGLEVRRHDAASLGAVLGPGFALVDEEVVDHTTPSGAVQPFTCARFRRR